MIRETPTWFYIIAKDHEARRAKVAGKWLCFAPTEEMHLYRDLLSKLVEDGTLLAAKMARKDPRTDPFPHKKDCVLCVYTSADRAEVARVEAKLRQVGLNPASWKSEQETKADWEPEGKLALEATIAKKKKSLSVAEKPVPTRSTREGIKVFISYRREDSIDAAGRLYDRLRDRWGKDNIFKDVDSLQPGLDFRDQLRQAVSQCQAVLVLIGAGWVDARDKNGKRRLDSEFDFVRIEVEWALQRSIPVIPVLVRRAIMPPADELPPSLKDLAFRHAVDVRADPHFHRDVDQLIEALESVAGEGRLSR